MELNGLVPSHSCCSLQWIHQNRAADSVNRSLLIECGRPRRWNYFYELVAELDTIILSIDAAQRV